MTTLTKRQQVAIENFAVAKLTEIDKELMQQAVEPSKIGESIYVSLEVEITDGEKTVSQTIWDKVENINTPASNLTALIKAINTASKRYGYNHNATLTVTDANGEEFYILFKSGFFEAKASVFLETVQATAGYLMQGVVGKYIRKALEKQIFSTTNLINLLAFLAVAEGKSKAQMEKLGFDYADRVQKLAFDMNAENTLQIENK